MNIKYYILQKKTPTPTEGTTGSNKRCFRCGETGHFIAKCPLPGPARGTPGGERGGRGRGGGRGAGRGGFYIERPKAETSRKVKEIFQREERYRKWRQAEELSMKMTREESEIMGVSGRYTNTHKRKKVEIENITNCCCYSGTSEPRTGNPRRRSAGKEPKRREKPSQATQRMTSR